MGDGYSNGDYMAGNAKELERLPKRLRTAGVGATTKPYPSFNDLASGKFPLRTSAEQISLYLNSGNQGLQFAAVGAAGLEGKGVLPHQ